MTKFAFFGCWNETHYPSKENLDAPCFQIQENTTKNPCDEFSFVLNNLKQNHNDIDFLVVAGDNYYPEKKTENGIKTKKFELTDFNRGFEALKSINKQTYLLLGNHDVDNIAPKIKNKSKKKGGSTPTKEKEEADCRIIHAEIDFVRDSNITLFDYKRELIVTEMQETNTLCIMVDTSIFIEKLDCYDSLLNESDKLWTKEQIIDQQKTMIETIIKAHKKPITNVCFFGHHPLLCLKKKEEIILEDNMEWNHFLFHVILKNGLQNIPNIYYFCADLHQYQEGVVTIRNNEHIINIHQYIAGTGGAYMDPEIQQNNIQENNLREISLGDDIYSSYRMIHSIQKNGFLIINNTTTMLNVVFHPVYLSKKAKSLSHLPSLRSRSRSRRRSYYLSRRGNQGILRSNSLGGKTRRIKRKSKY
jgi:hypothetical protein